jgi:hypothetical protein
MSYTRRFEDPRSFEAWKRAKKHQEANMEEIQARSRSRKKQTIQFWIPEYLIFLDQIESEYGLRFSLFRKDLVIFDSKCYILLTI